MSMSLPGAQPAGGPGHDLLVPEPYDSLDAVWSRLKGMLRLCGKPLAMIALLTVAVPQILSAWVNTTVTGEPVFPVEDSDAAAFTIPSAGAFAWLLAIYLAVMFVGAIGWGAGVWVATAAAAGRPVTMGPALTAGVRRVKPMFGWYLVYTLMIMVGLFLCIVPGIYLGVAGALFGFVVMFEPGRNPIGRSFSLVHSAFGTVLGRVALMFLFGLAVACVVGLLLSVAGLGDPEPASTAAYARDTLVGLVAVPLYPVLLVGLLLTYTQLRARQEQVTTGTLVVEISQ